MQSAIKLKSQFWQHEFIGIGLGELKVIRFFPPKFLTVQVSESRSDFSKIPHP